MGELIEFYWNRSLGVIYDPKVAMSTSMDGYLQMALEYIYSMGNGCVVITTLS